jgi:predicted ATP-dependent serine protease
MTKAGKKELAVRAFFGRNHKGSVPNNLTVQQLYSAFMANGNAADVSYGLFNGVVKKMRVADAKPAVDSRAPIRMEEPKTPKAEVIEIGKMKFPNFRAYKTGGIIDRLFSDHTADGGIFSGTANIVIGESGVGKSTVTLDILSKIKKEQPDAKILYISSEMTRNDLYFYFQKTPIIANVPTLLVMDYVSGRFDQVLEETMNGDYDVILIDSHQDIIVKLADILGWKSTKAQTWLTNLIIDAADRHGKTIFAIQHMTKGGQYVGSTYLKHATTSMMEIKFDDAGRRYVEFSKNRRGGSLVNKRLYYSLEAGEVVWDEQAWTQEHEASKLASAEKQRKQELEARFNDLFLSVNRPADEKNADAVGQ